MQVMIEGCGGIAWITKQEKRRLVAGRLRQGLSLLIGDQDGAKVNDRCSGISQSKIIVLDQEVFRNRVKLVIKRRNHHPEPGPPALCVRGNDGIRAPHPLRELSVAPSYPGRESHSSYHTVFAGPADSPSLFRA